MGDINRDQFQTQQKHDIADKTAEQVDVEKTAS